MKTKRLSRFMIILIVIVMLLMSGSTSLLAAPGSPPGQEKEDVLIGFYGQPNRDLVNQSGGEVYREFTLVNVIAAKLPQQAIDALLRNPAVRYIEPDSVVMSIAQHVPWSIDRVFGPEEYPFLTWQQPVEHNVSVAVLDTGIDRYHEDLPLILGGVNTIDSTHWGIDEYGHGTHVAGTIAALDNSRGVVGVAPGIGLYSVKVMDYSGYGTVSSVVDGIEWADGKNIPVINMSLGLNTYNKTLHDAVDAAYANGMILVAAVGNTSGGSVFYPAAFSSVIAVAASDSSDKLATFSSVGEEIELIAPGVSITSTFPGSRYATMNGTSMASPHVAGVAALTWSVNSALTNTEVRQTLRQSAQDLSLPADHQGYGLVKADLAVAAAVPEPASDKAFFGIGLYEKFNSKFYLKYSTEAGNADHTFSFYGSNNDWIPVSGDWNDDGFHSGAIYDQQEGRFHIKDYTISGYADRTFRYGPKGNDWLPVAGDWDGDGIYGVALYNQRDGIFYIKDHTTPGPADRTFRYGPKGNDWLPVAGDWTGDGEYGVALYNQRDGIFYIKDHATPGPADRTFRYGPRNNDWLPATGDWTGDGIYGVALYDQLNGSFFVKNQTTPGPADCTFRYGPRNNNWLPLAGIWQK